MLRVPDLDQKLDTLMSLAADDRDGPPPRLRHARRSGSLGPLNIRRLRSSGRETRLLRILMTNACSYNCHYCPMRRDRDLPRTLLKPEELVRIFLGAVRRGWVDGLFVTTGIPSSPVKVMDNLITALELLRERHGFAGYIHVKLVAGAEPAQIERLTALASVCPSTSRLPAGRRSPGSRRRRAWRCRWRTWSGCVRWCCASGRRGPTGGRRDPLHPGGVAGMTMQFVVGATPDTDRTLIETVARLQNGGGIHHAHFSAFRPIADTPMEHTPAAPALREHRLYQADYLLHDYGFTRGRGGVRARRAICRSRWIRRRRGRWRIRSGFRWRSCGRTTRTLLRVPGIGPVAARRLVNERAGVTLRGLKDLRGLGVVTTRAGGFLTLRGRRLQTTRWTEQLGFWAPEEEAGAYHLTLRGEPGDVPLGGTPRYAERRSLRSWLPEPIGSCCESRLTRTLGAAPRRLEMTGAGHRPRALGVDSPW